MKMYINGEWVDREAKIPVLNPFDQSVIDTVPVPAPAMLKRPLPAPPAAPK